GVAAQPSRSTTATLLLNRTKHVRKVAWVIPDSGDELGTENVCLAFVLTAVLQGSSAESNLAPHADDVTASSANDTAGNLTQDGADLKFLRFRGLGCRMAKHNVADLMPHDTRHFTFGFCCFNHAPIHKHATTRKRTGSDLSCIDDFEGVMELGLAELCWDG